MPHLLRFALAWPLLGGVTLAACAGAHAIETTPSPPSATTGRLSALERQRLDRERRERRIRDGVTQEALRQQGTASHY